MWNLQHSEKQKERAGERVRRRKEGKGKGMKGGGREEKRKGEKRRKTIYPNFSSDFQNINS